MDECACIRARALSLSSTFHFDITTKIGRSQHKFIFIFINMEIAINVRLMMVNGCVCVARKPAKWEREYMCEWWENTMETKRYCKIAFEEDRFRNIYVYLWHQQMQLWQQFKCIPIIHKKTKTTHKKQQDHQLAQHRQQQHTHTQKNWNQGKNGRERESKWESGEEKTRNKWIVNEIQVNGNYIVWCMNCACARARARSFWWQICILFDAVWHGS